MLVALRDAQPSLHPIRKHAMGYSNATGHWMGLQEMAFELFDAAAKDLTFERKEEETEVSMGLLGAGFQLLEEFALQVLAMSVEFYNNSNKELVAARLDQKLHEEDVYHANDVLDERA